MKKMRESNKLCKTFFNFVKMRIVKVLIVQIKNNTDDKMVYKLCCLKSLL